MPQLVFTLTWDTETGAKNTVGSMDTVTAKMILEQIIIQSAVTQGIKDFAADPGKYATLVPVKDKTKKEQGADKAAQAASDRKLKKEAPNGK